MLVSLLTQLIFDVIPDDLLVKYTEEEIAFKADLISTKVLTSELVKHFKLKKPTYLTMTTRELVTSLKEVVKSPFKLATSSLVVMVKYVGFFNLKCFTNSLVNTLVEIKSALNAISSSVYFTKRSSGITSKIN